MQKTSKTIPFYANGMRFSCIRCSACCRFDSGYVYLSENDTYALAAALNLSYQDFIQSYCRWVSSSNGVFTLSLKEKSNYDCVFWASKPLEGCLVYESRPLQCRSFPFWHSILDNKYRWKITAKSCPGMDKGALNSYESIKKWLVMRQNEPIISRDNIFDEMKGEF